MKQSEATIISQYSKVLQAVEDSSLAIHIPKSSKSTSLKPTYLCLQCTTVSDIQTRDQHDPAHRLCKTLKSSSSELTMKVPSPHTVPSSVAIARITSTTRPSRTSGYSAAGNESIHPSCLTSTHGSSQTTPRQFHAGPWRCGDFTTWARPASCLSSYNP